MFKRNSSVFDDVLKQDIAYLPVAVIVVFVVAAQSCQ